MANGTSESSLQTSLTTYLQQQSVLRVYSRGGIDATSVITCLHLLLVTLSFRISNLSQINMEGIENICKISTKRKLCISTIFHNELQNIIFHVRSTSLKWKTTVVCIWFSFYYFSGFALFKVPDLNPALPASGVVALHILEVTFVELVNILTEIVKLAVML